MPLRNVNAAHVVAGLLAEMSAPADWTAELCAAAGIPALDVTSTAMSTRAGALGLAAGRGFVHHELRVRAPMPDGLGPEVAVWDGGTVPEWRDGVLAEPKYFSFFQDAPLPVFNPNYRGKWRPHELLHSAVGFFWAPDMTRFAFYVGARASEILPVVHWYHFDEMFRPRCCEHRRAGALRLHCQACEDVRVPYWERPADEGEADEAVRRLTAGMEHLAEELGACREELRTGRVEARPRPGLDSASDAQGYLRSHWNRCTAWSFGTWVELFLVEGEDYVSTPTALLSRVERVAQELMEPARPVDGERFAAMLGRRALQDLGYRILLELERQGEGCAAEEALLPLLEAAGGLCRDTDGDPGVVGARRELLEASDALGLGQVGAQGLVGGRRIAAEVAQVSAGLASAFQQAPEGAAVQLVEAAGFWGPGRLGSRFVACDVDAAAGDAERAQRRLEAWLAAEPRCDGEAEMFGGVADGAEQVLGHGRFRASLTLRRGTFPASVLGEEGPPVELAGTRWDGEARVIALTASQKAVLDWVASGAGGPVPDDSALLDLVQVGALVWFPPVQGDSG